MNRSIDLVYAAAAMSEKSPQTRTFVVDQRVFEVTVQPGSIHARVLTVVADGREQWSFDTAAWSPESYGCSDGDFYLWTARELIIFGCGQPNPAQVGAGEDILLVFKVESGWLFVCESSVRLFVDSQECAHISMQDVIESARWLRNRLIILDQAGRQYGVVVKDMRLLLESSM